LLGPAVLMTLAAPARADDAGAFLQSARQLEKVHDLSGAAIQLRNAAQAAPANAAIRLELARIYLLLRDPNAAEAELFAAHLRGAREDATAAMMAQAMLETGAFGDLLKKVSPGNRPPKTESLVRSYRGMAEMDLNEFQRARVMFADAERLDPKSPLPLIGETRLLIQQHALDAAEQKVDLALKLAPRNADALDAKGLLFEARGQVDAATHQFAAAIAADPKAFRALLDRANLEVERGNLDAAEKDLATIRRVAPRSLMSVYLQASIDGQRGKFKDADALLEKARGAMAQFPPAYLIAAQVKFKLNQLDQAEGLARKFIAQTGDQPKAWQLLGLIALKRGNLDGGIAALEKAVELAPNDPDELAMLGQAYIARGDFDKAKSVFDQAAARAPGNAPIATERTLADFATGDRQASVAALGDIFKGGKGTLMAGPPLVIEGLQLGQLDVAEAAARQLMERDPSNVTYQELLAAVRIARHDYSGAEVLLRSLVAKQPNLFSARRDLAQIYLATRRDADAKKLYNDRLGANPNDIESLEALAEIALHEHDDNGAIALLTRAQRAAPADARPSLRIVAIFEGRKKWPDAIGRARALHTKFAKDAGVADALARLYFESGDHTASEAAYKAATGKFPNYGPIFLHYAAALAADGKYAAAAPLALRACQLDPRNADFKRAFVTLTYLATGADAAFAASQLVTHDKTGSAAALMTADVLESNNNRAAAIALLEKRQAQSPSGSVIVKLAALYLHANRLDDARRLLETWTAAHPDDVEARFALAQIDSAMGKMSDALAQYEWLVARKPYNPVILNDLAWLYDVRHDRRARTTAEKALRLAPGSGSVADTLGWILAGQGDAGGAARYLAQASGSQPADATIQYHYAVVLSRTGKTEQAREVLKKVLKLNPQPQTKSDAETLLAKLRSSPPAR
jgi:putative PEP-CTERM system TPR-repeat lipoprotein